jgi:2-polyprenyl-6-methoxyphenol hydroxylase-like FAD-dependent oxidoreductase
MAEDRHLHVLIAGGGLAGLALAQGVTRSGHTVEVFERDADFNRKQGYYLHFNPIGGEALRRVLPDDLYELYLETSRQNYDRHESIVLNSQFEEITSQPHLGPPNDGPRPHTGVHRRTLRQILSARLDGSIRRGCGVVSFAQDEDSVTATLSDGGTATGDLLVGADGIRSAVRTQLLPQVPVIPTGIRGIGVYGRTPLTPELDSLMPDILNQGVLMAIDQRGGRLLVATFRPRRPAAEAAEDIAPDVALDDVPGYVMISCTVGADTVVPPAADWTAETPLILRASMARTVEGWHPAAKALVEGMEPDSIFAIPFGFLDPAEHWEPSRVTVVGDAAHAMLPTLGMGANLSLNDSALLTEQLDRYARGDVDLLTAVGTYERQMRDTAYPILRRTLDHDTNFGGGGLAGADESDNVREAAPAGGETGERPVGEFSTA